MSTEISIYGLAFSHLVGGYLTTPRIVEHHSEMGFSQLARTLEYVAQTRPDLLEEYTINPVPGLRQYYVYSVRKLIEHIEGNPHVWDGVGLGFQDGVELMRKRQELAWWFHVCS